MPSTRVVVTGLGTTSPVGGDVASTWQAMLSGTSGIRRLTDEWVDQLPVKIGGRVAVEPSEVLERVKARRWDRSTQFAVVAADQAFEDEGTNPVTGSDEDTITVGPGRFGGTGIVMPGVASPALDPSAATAGPTEAQARESARLCAHSDGGASCWVTWSRPSLR